MQECSSGVSTSSVTGLILFDKKDCSFIRIFVTLVFLIVQSEDGSCMWWEEGGGGGGFLFMF